MKKIKSKKVDLIYVGDRFNGSTMASAFVKSDDLGKELQFKKRSNYYWKGDIHVGHEEGDNMQLEVKGTGRKFENEKISTALTCEKMKI